jgi:malonyl-CoA decarboxylase
VVEVLGAEFGNLNCFATLSPIPGFRSWLEARLEAADATLVTEEEAQALRLVAPPEMAIAAPGADPADATPETPAQTLRRLIARRGWARVEGTAKLLEPILTRACARYLLAESGRDGKRARDPVAHFHLSNGARVERLNWRGDTSDKGFREACGLMVNYRYDPAKIETYHEDYAGEGKRAASPAIRKLAKGFL